MKISKNVKKIFSIYNIAVVVCIFIITISLFIILKPDSNKKTTSDGVEIVQAQIKENEQITEIDAKKLAIKQFKNIDESGLKQEDLKVVKIQRSGEEYYYISSKKNTLEIKILGGEITRINSVVI